MTLISAACVHLLIAGMDHSDVGPDRVGLRFSASTHGRYPSIRYPLVPWYWFIQPAEYRGDLTQRPVRRWVIRWFQIQNIIVPFIWSGVLKLGMEPIQDLGGLVESLYRRMAGTFGLIESDQ